MAKDTALTVGQIGLPAVGMGVGAFFGGPGGAAAGAAVGSALGQGLGLFKRQPGLPPVSGARRQALGVSTHVMEAMTHHRGATPEMMANLMEISRSQTLEQLGMLNVLPSQLSAVDRANISRGLQTAFKDSQIRADKLTEAYDPRAEAERVVGVSKAAAAVAGQAESIDVYETRRELHRQQIAERRQAAFAQAMGSLTTAIAGAIPKRSPETGTFIDQPEEAVAQATTYIQSQEAQMRADIEQHNRMQTGINRSQEIAHNAAYLRYLKAEGGS